MWRRLCGGAYVAALMWWRLCGGADVVALMWWRLCGGAYVMARWRLCGGAYVADKNPIMILNVKRHGRNHVRVQDFFHD